MDAAYDCSVIDNFIRGWEHIPVIAPNTRGNESPPPLDPVKKERYKKRTEVERANSIVVFIFDKTLINKVCKTF
jgi:hypothetical protein